MPGFGKTELLPDPGLATVHSTVNTQRVMRDAWLLGAALCAMSCGSNEASEPGPQPCDGDPASGVCVLRVTGSLVDFAGSPVESAPVSVCGDVCYYGASDAAGKFDVSIANYIEPAAYHVLVHERTSRASFYYSLTGSPDAGVLAAGELLVLLLPESGPELVVAGAGAPAQSVTSGAVTLDVPAGVDVKLDVEDVTAGPVGSQFRALAVPQSAWQQFVPAETAALALYALAPFEATFREQGAKTKAKAQLSFVNTTGLPPSAAVEVMILGSYYVEQSLPPGTFGPAALGHVSVDGTRIMLDDGEGVEYLSWLALREKK